MVGGFGWFLCGLGFDGPIVLTLGSLAFFDSPTIRTIYFHKHLGPLESLKNQGTMHLLKTDQFSNNVHNALAAPIVRHKAFNLLIYFT